MFDQLPSLAQLIRVLNQVPYLASKNVYRVATHFLQLEPARVEQFCAFILNARAQIIQCQICFAWQEKDRKCVWCASPKRDQALVCVVETWQELMAIEKSGGYQGVYHVLGGAICPLEGIGPEQLTIMHLVNRAKNGLREIILATNQTPEGEATAAYIASKLKETNVVVSCLARGVPVGSALEYIDRVTLYKALSERRPF